MTCFCGAIDCPSCGRAQGYKVVKHNGTWRELESLIEDARDGEQAIDFAAQLDPEDAQMFIAKMISTAALDDKHAAIDAMIDKFREWFL